MKSTRLLRRRVPSARRQLASLAPQPNYTRITPPYERLTSQLKTVRGLLGPERPLTLAEKILFTHLWHPEEALSGGEVRGTAYLKLRPDRVAMQDASAQMALLQFMTCGLDRTSVDASIHCDHLIVGRHGGREDVESAIANNREIFDFLQSCAQRYGIQFWGPGSGIIHQIVLENYAAPGGMMLGTDSHTPNAGGLGMIAIGVGGADAVDAMTDTPWELKAPKIIGVRLNGHLDGWASAKDLILTLAGRLTVRGGTGHIIEYTGPGVASLSATGMATICNMGAEVGATTSLFPHTDAMDSYLRATRRAPVADAALRVRDDLLVPDAGAQYDEIVEIDLSTLEPHVNGPFTPDLSTPISKFGDAVRENSWPTELSCGLIGSCTNSSYEDMTRVANVVAQATDAGLVPQTPLLVTPGSEQIRATMERDGLTAQLRRAGATVLANACGPCIGMWDRTAEADANAILTSFNRNFRARNDGNARTMNFLASPEIVAAKIFSRDLAFDPVRDEIPAPDGSKFRFRAPTGTQLPNSGFDAGDVAYLPAPEAVPDAEHQVRVDPQSDRLELLEPFDAWDGRELDLTVAVRVRGKCTTDHISAAGPWLKYKGHLSNICNNTLIGATNADTGEVNVAYDLDSTRHTIPDLMWRWRDEGRPWIVVAEHNYGEGSAREHAALQPRAMNGKAILAKSFARIHETNLKKQGMLPLTFVDEADYDRISAGDRVVTHGLADLVRNGSGDITLEVVKRDGTRFTIPVAHTMSRDQLEFFRAGSALNVIRERALARASETSGARRGEVPSGVRTYCSGAARTAPSFSAIGRPLWQVNPQRAHRLSWGREGRVHRRLFSSAPRTLQQTSALQDALACIRAQPRQYAEVHVHQQKYLVTPGDCVTIPVRLRDVSVGQVIRFTRVSMLGSRDYTIHGKPYVDPKYFRCTAVVVEHTKSSMIVHLRHRRRRRHVRTVRQKQPYTVLRIKELEIGTPSAL